jgi:hypothetical protein
MNNSQRQLNALQRQRQQFQTWDDSVLDYRVNWAACFPGDPVVISTWTVLHGTASVDPQTTVGNTTCARVQASLGRVVLINTVVTEGNQKDSRSLLIVVSSKQGEITAPGDYVAFGGDYAEFGGEPATW